MMKKCIKGGILIFLTALSSCNLTQPSAEEKVIISEKPQVSEAFKVSESSIKNSVEYLASDELLGRETGTAGIEKAAGFIEKEFRNSKIQPYFNTYRDHFEINGKKGFNIVGLIEGTNPELKKEFIILGAHYDHIGIGKKVGTDSIANGANDNAAGTVAVMELAKHFAKERTNERSILVVLFSAEELGLEGAKHISSKLKSKNLDLYAMVNFEMIGVPMIGKEYLAYLTGFENSNFAEKFNEYSNARVLGFLPQAKEYNLFQRSDNYPFFQEFKVPAQTISTFDFTNYEFYHHVSDEAQRMDFAHMARLIESVIPGLTAMTTTAEKEIKMN